MTHEDKRDLYRGLDDAWTHAIEMVLTPFVAGAIGYLIDRVLGTVPVFTIVLVVMAGVAAFIKMYYSYDAKMRALEAASPWGAKDRARQTVPDALVESRGGL